MTGNAANENQENKSDVDHVTTGVFIRERLAGIPLADDRVRERLRKRALAELALAWISNKQLVLSETDWRCAMRSVS